MVFARSEQFWLSLIALGIMGAADTVSVVIRVSLVQLATPDAMRGRSGAPSDIFVCVAGRTLSELAYLIASVAIAWQVYAMTGSAFYLGMVGLAQFVPSALLTFVAGHADKPIPRQHSQTHYGSAERSRSLESAEIIRPCLDR